MSKKSVGLVMAFAAMMANSVGHNPNSRGDASHKRPFGTYRHANKSKHPIDPNFKILPRERNKPDAYKKATIELKKLGTAISQIPPHYFKEAQ